MTDLWQQGSTPPPPPTTPPAFTPPAANAFLAGSAPKAGPSRAKLAALAGVGVVAAAGAWLTFGQSSGKPAAAPAPHVAAKPVVQVSTAPAAPVLPPLAKPPTHGLDLGAAPSLAVAIPKIELFVEESRGHRFKRHVPVTPLSNKAFVAALRKADGPGSNDPNADASSKALHLLPAGLPSAGGREPDSAFADIVGFYDFRSKALYVRGTTLNPLVQSIVAHELTHALDDQYFDLKHVQSLGKNSDQSEAILSLIEGDARFVENSFSAALVPARKAQQDAERAAYLTDAASAAPVSDIPDPFVLELFALFPYELGSNFITALHGEGGPATIDAAFAKPPTSTLQILDPDGHFVERIDAVKVPAPSYPKSPGTKVIDRDTLGTLGLASVLAEGHPIDWNSEDVVSGWAGDSYVTTRAGGTTCVRDAVRTTTAKSATSLDKALTTWATHYSGASVRLTSKTGLLLVSCVG